MMRGICILMGIIRGLLSGLWLLRIPCGKITRTDWGRFPLWAKFVCFSFALGWWATSFLIIFMFFCVLSGARAHDGQHDEWFSNLARHSPDGNTTYLCCNTSDCRVTDARIRTDPDGTHWEALIPKDIATGPAIGEPWQKVPDDHVLTPHDNPTGNAVVCWYQDSVWCFVPPTGV